MIEIHQSIEELPKRDNNLQNKHLKSSASEVFKVCTDIAYQIVKQIFILRICLYSVYCVQEMEGTLCLTWYSISFVDPKIWDLVLGKIKQSEPLSVFKANFRK